MIMCKIFHIRDIINENAKLKSELDITRERYDQLDYLYNNLKKDYKSTKNQQELLKKYQLQIEDLKSAIDIISGGGVDEDAIRLYIANDFSLDALINFKAEQCKKDKNTELDEIELKPIEFFEDIR